MTRADRTSGNWGRAARAQMKSGTNTRLSNGETRKGAWGPMTRGTARAATAGSGRGLLWRGR